MIGLADLEAHFYPVEPLANGPVRCADELPDRTIYTYVRLAGPGEPTRIAVSDDRIDDDFARLLLESADDAGLQAPSLAPLPVNR